MKLRNLIAVIVCSSCFAEEPKATTNPEISKIDARLSELAEIWRQDVGVINRLTNFKRTPVQEGTKAYFQCLEASKRIKQAEAEAKTLKRKKAAIEQGKPIPDATSSSSQESNSNDNSAFAEPEEQATDSNGEKMGFAVAKNVVPSVAYDNVKHGPKIKDLFIGMSMTDCEKKLDLLTGEPYRTIVAVNDTQLWENALANGARLPNRIPISKGIFVLTPQSSKIGMIEKESITAMANSNGLVRSLLISGGCSKLLFKAQALSIEDFVKNFNEGYNLSLKLDAETGSIFYKQITEEGVLIQIDQNFSVILVETDKPEDVKKAFD